MLFFIKITGDSFKNAVKNAGNGPDYPCPMPFHGVKTPTKINRDYNAPVNCRDWVKLFFKVFLFYSVIVLLKKFFGCFPGDSGTDKNINSRGSNHKSKAKTD